MTLNKAFRLSTYLSLAFSTACLGYSERLHLPAEAAGFYPALIMVLIVAFIVEDRWAMPNATAHLVAVGIVLLWVAWLAVNWQFGTADEFGFDLVHWALPRMGPLLGILLLAKLFRPKFPSDYWMLHMLALIQIALACVLDRDLIFGLLLLGYIIATIWSLMLFYMHRESAVFCTEAPPVRGQARQAPRAYLPPWRLLGLRQMTGWGLLSLFFGMLMFFLVPRPGQGGVGALFIPSGRSETGFAPEMNLNNSGPIDISNEPVMYVEAYDSEGAQIDIPPDQRWRGVSCSRYAEGRWTSVENADRRDMATPENLPDLGPDYVRYKIHLELSRVPREATRFQSGDSVPLFLAEPALYTDYVRSGLPSPLMKVTNHPGGRGTLRTRMMETGVTLVVGKNNLYLDYEQIALAPGPSARLGEGLPRYVVPNYEIQLRTLPQGDRVARIAEKAREILAKAAVPADAGDEAKARALERHLSASGEYQYTLDRQRTDTGLDPTADFLCNVKQGHCELYASGLALMLRTQGIPARVVIGFRGAQPGFGHHVVLQSHAHAWVEAFIREREDVPGNRYHGRWITLDGTPIFDAIGMSAALHRSGWESFVDFANFVWQYFILDYDADSQRQQLVFRLQNLGVLPKDGGGIMRVMIVVGVVIGLIGVTVGVVYLIRLLRGRQGRRGVVLHRQIIAFYARLVRLLSRIALRPRPAQTPRELGALAGDVLHQRHETAAVADVPAQVAEAFYEVRFGGRDLDDRQLQAIEEKLDRLDQSLQTGR